MEALRQCGNIEIERPLTAGFGQTRPDVFLRSDKTGPLAKLPPCYIEISAISDDGYDAENPREYFIGAFTRLLKRLHLPLHRFRLDLHGAMHDKTVQKQRSADSGNGQIDWATWFRGSSCNDRKMHLALPPKREIEKFVSIDVAKELSPIVKNPLRKHNIVFRSDRASLDISYDPQQAGFSYGFPSYTTAYSLEYNPVAKRLVTKANQIRKGAGLRGVILCDRGCDLLKDRGYPGPSGFRLRDVMANVLARREELSFVITYSVVEKLNGWWRHEGLQLSVSAFYNPDKASLPVDERMLDTLVRRIRDHMPAPVETPRNARYSLERNIRR